MNKIRLVTKSKLGYNSQYTIFLKNYYKNALINYHWYKRVQTQEDYFQENSDF